MNVDDMIRYTGGAYRASRKRVSPKVSAHIDQQQAAQRAALARSGVNLNDPEHRLIILGLVHYLTEIAPDAVDDMAYALSATAAYAAHLHTEEEQR